MSNLSDPIADFLTRLRNASQASLPQVVAPYSKIKAEIARLLKQEGYITAYEIATDGKFPQLKVSTKFVNRTPAITGLKRVSRPGAPALCRLHGDSAGVGWDGGFDPLHAERHHHRPRSQEAECRRRIARLRLVTFYLSPPMSRIGKKPIESPAKVKLQISPEGAVSVEGPKGKLGWTLPRGIQGRLIEKTTCTSSTGPVKERKVRALHGLVPRRWSIIW